MSEKDQSWKKNILLLIISQTISLFGSSLVQYAIMWYITLETKSGIMMTVYIICGFLPTFFLSPFAGVWADRYDRKKLIVIADASIAVTTLILGIVFLMGYKAIWLLFLAAAIRAFGSAVHSPALSAFVPQFVPESKLNFVNGINSSVQSTTMLISPMVSGALLSIAPIERIFFIDVVTAIIGISTILLFLKVPPHEKALQKQEVSYITDLKLGYAYVKQHHFLKTFFFYCGILFFLFAPAAFLTPLQVTRNYGEAVWRLTAIEIAFSVGMMLGGLVMAYWKGFNNKVYTMIFANIVMGLCTIGVGLTAYFPLYLFFMLSFGVAMPFFNTPSMVMIQTKVEPDFMGRVFGILNMISSSMMPLGMLIFGPAADVMPIEVMLLITGVLILVLSLSMHRNKELIAAGQD